MSLKRLCRLPSDAQTWDQTGIRRRPQSLTLTQAQLLKPRPHAALGTRAIGDKFLLSLAGRIGPRAEFLSVFWVFEDDYENLLFASYLRTEFPALVTEGHL